MSEIDGVKRDGLQELLADFTSDLTFQSLSPGSIHAAKARLIDTVGALLGGYFAEPCQIAREIGFKVAQGDGATIIGTRHLTTPELAAFVNATTARYVEMNDVYHQPGGGGGHPSDVLTPVLAVAEHVHATGEAFITALVIAYEVYLRIADNGKTKGFDNSMLSCLGVAAASAKLLGCDAEQLRHAIAIAVVSNVYLNQTRTGQLSMWKAAAAGQSGRSGVFAALTARAGMEGPHLPFEGEHGWLNQVARRELHLEPFGTKETRYKIEDSLIKLRPSCGSTISSILAAEKAYRLLGNPDDIRRVVVETYAYAVEGHGTGEQRWNPNSRYTADHSIPYVVAATLRDGTITPRQFDDAHLSSELIRNVLKKVEVLENPEFTADSERTPMIHRTRVSVERADGQVVVGESGGGAEDLSSPKTDVEIREKFLGLSEELLGTKRCNRFMDVAWNLENLPDIAAVPTLLAL